MQATEETKRVSLPALFAEIQVLKEEHSRLILHIENERDARRAAILETEQMKVTIAEHNKRIESLLVLKARTEISVVEAREEFAFLATGASHRLRTKLISPRTYRSKQSNGMSAGGNDPGTRDAT